MNVEMKTFVDDDDEAILTLPRVKCPPPLIASYVVIVEYATHKCTSMIFK